MRAEAPRPSAFAASSSLVPTYVEEQNVVLPNLDYPGWRRDEWTPAVKAAGLEHRAPYALRHTFASFAIAAGLPTFEIARMMGTSIEQIEKTYGHLLPDALERGRAALGAFDTTMAEDQASAGT